MHHFKDFISFFIVHIALICILAIVASFFLAIGMHIAEVVMSF